MFSKIMSFILSVVALFSGFTVNRDTNVTVYKNVPYGIRVKRQVLDLYIPDDVKGDANMILYVHGGSWTSGSKDDYTPVLEEMSEKGYVCGALSYRYCGKPNYASVYDIMDDITAALKVIKEKAVENGVNLKGVMLDGGSAGAHLSLLYAYSKVDEAPIKPVAVVARSPVADLTDMTLYDGSLHELDTEKWCIPKAVWEKNLSCMIGKRVTDSNFEKRMDRIYDISPIKYVNENSVPTIIAHGTLDTVLPYSGSVAFDKKLTEYGVEHQFITYEGAWHGLLDCPEADIVMAKVYNEYLEKYVKGTGENK